MRRTGCQRDLLTTTAFGRVQLFLWIPEDILEELRRGWATLQRVIER